MTDMQNLYKRLVDLLYSVPGPDRRRAYWIMSGEWHDKIADYAVNTLGAPEPEHWTELLGLPFEVNDDHGFPELVIPDV